MSSGINKKKAGWIALFAIVAAILLAPFSGYLLLPNEAHAQQRSFNDNENPRSEFWRSVREGNSGYSAIKGDEANVLIQNGGENWRQLRKPIAQYGSWALAVVVIACRLFFIIRGPLKIEKGLSGLTVPRWTYFERVLHWTNATLFIILAVTGLSLMYGRTVLLPIIGKDVFSAYAGLAKTVHDYLGPLFGIVLAVLLFRWFLMNIPKSSDVTWFLKGGGLFTDDHVPAGKTNGGEKLWFWLLFVCGTMVVITGVVLDFPNLGFERSDMQLANMIHSASALILTSAAIGHIFIGTVGSEGSLQAMTTGRVDAEWAKQHHDLWYQELLEQDVKPEVVDSSSEKTRGSDSGAHSTA